MEESQEFWSDTSEILENWLEYQAFFERAAGISVSVFHEGEEVFSYFSGYRDIEVGEKVDSETVFRMASISKVFTATAILKLHEEGKLWLDDQIGEYLDWVEEDATIRQALYHCSGLKREGGMGYWGSLEFPDEEQLREAFEEDQKVFPSNKEWKYSNIGYALLGQVLEEVKGESFHEVIQEEVFDEIGLERAFFSDGDLGNLAKPYSRDIPGEKIESIDYSGIRSIRSAAGLIACPENVNRFLHSLRKGGLVSKDTWREMKREQWELPSGEKWALGLKKFQEEGREILCHNGSLPGTGSSAMICPEEGLEVTVSANRQGFNAYETAKSLLKTLFQLQEEFVENESVPEQFTGRYAYLGGEFDIRSIGGELIGFYPGQNPPLQGKFILERLEDNKFKITESPGSGYPGEKAVFLEDGDVIEISSIESRKIEEEYTLEKLWN